MTESPADEVNAHFNMLSPRSFSESMSKLGQEHRSPVLQEKSPTIFIKGFMICMAFFYKLPTNYSMLAVIR